MAIVVEADDKNEERPDGEAGKIGFARQEKQRGERRAHDDSNAAEQRGRLFMPAFGGGAGDQTAPMRDFNHQGRQ